MRSLSGVRDTASVQLKPPSDTSHAQRLVELHITSLGHAKPKLPQRCTMIPACAIAKHHAAVETEPPEGSVFPVNRSGKVPGTRWHGLCRKSAPDQLLDIEE